MARPLPRRSSAMWWNRSMPYRIFLLRELSAVSIAIYMVLLLILVQQVRAGEGSFDDYLDVLQKPVVVISHIVALLFALLHTVTWFQAVPKALPLKIGERRVPPMQLIAGNYVIWAVVSVVVLIVFLA